LVRDRLGGKESLYILGDLTDAKDGHNATLVNRILESLASMNCPVYLLQGNHDYIDDKQAFFSFLEGETYGSSIKWYSNIDVPEPGVLMVPHSRNPSEEWEAIDIPEDTHTIFCHQTFDGANAGSFALSASVGPRYFQEVHGFAGTVISGDIHVPQTLPKTKDGVTYVGSPYPVSFGDSFTPRVLHVTDGTIVSSIETETIRRHTLTIESEQDLEACDFLCENDQVKLKVMLPRSEFQYWETHKKAILSWCQGNKIEVFAIELKEQSKKVRKKTKFDTKTAPKSGADLLDMFGKGLDPDVLSVGKELLQNSITKAKD
jgi:DNA repair exonuclease SbcCD nuclease subunit